jgi:riboflavin synthase
VDEFEVEAVEETLKKTTLNSMTVGDHCNLELPIRFHERMGGHFVLGHVDVVGHIRHIEERAGSWVMTVEVPELFEKYLIPVGSIAIDGVSFTLAEVRGNVFKISVVPYTMENTICKFYETREAVNIEFDVVGKYIERFVKDRLAGAAAVKPFFTEVELRELGYE